MEDSVTVSIGEETMGKLSGMFFEKCEEMMHCDLFYHDVYLDSISPYCGTMRISLKVSEMGIVPLLKVVE